MVNMALMLPIKIPDNARKNEEYFDPAVGGHNGSAVKNECPDEFQPLVCKKEITSPNPREASPTVVSMVEYTQYIRIHTDV